MKFTRWHISVVVGCAMIMIGAAVGRPFSRRERTRA